MKLGISYNLFDGEELLEASIKAIRSQVDYISVVYQKKSYFGDECSSDLLDVLNELIDKKHVDEIYEYNPIIDTTADAPKAHMQQVEKRNIGLELSKKNGCTYHMPIDTDEFYLSNQFACMKKVLEEGQYDASACKHNQYYKDSIYMIYPKEEEYVATIFKINKDTKFVYDIPCIVPIDPSRKTNNTNYKIFSRYEIEMHHMSFVRKNLRRKLMTSIARNDISEKIDKIVEYYDNWEYPQPAMWAGGNLLKVAKVEKVFDINIW